MLVETGADDTESDSEVLDYAMCVNKVLHMQRVFLTERESDSTNHTSDTASASVPAEGTECKDALKLASSSLTMDTASVDSSSPPAAESDEIMCLQTDAVQLMDESN